MITGAVTATGEGLKGDNGDGGWPGIFSRFQLVLLASRRSKQLFNGAHPRIPADPLKRRNTSIALEELRLGLVRFKAPDNDPPATENSLTNLCAASAAISSEVPGAL